jgi:hypothetical protein
MGISLRAPQILTGQGAYALQARAGMKRVLFLIVLAIASDGLEAEAGPANATDPAILKGHIWDQDIVIGPGAYRVVAQAGTPTAPAAGGSEPAKTPPTPPPAIAGAPTSPKSGGATENKPSGFNFFNLPPSETPPAPPAPPVPAASIPPPAPAAPAAAKQPIVKEIRSLDELLLPVPLDHDLFSDGRVNPAAVEAANSAVDRAAAGKPIAVRVPFGELLAHRRDGYAFRLRGEPQPLTLRGRKVTGHVVVLFRADQSAALGRLGKGSVVPVKGIISRAEITGEGRNVDFRVIIADGAMQ